MVAAVESMVFSGAVPWHGLGEEITGETSFWDAFQLAGLDWEVEKRPVYRRVPHDRYNGQDFEIVEGRYESTRTSDGKAFGIVGPQWTPLQNRDAFKVFEPMVESGDLLLHTAGSLMGGARVWVLGKLNLDNDEIVKGDEISKFALLSNGHDGMLAVHFGFTPIRVVCANTEALARRSKASQLIRVRHHRFVCDNVEKLRDVMNLAKGEFEATSEKYRFLASRGINRDDLRKYIKVVLETEPGKLTDKKEEDISTRQMNIIEKIEEFHDAGIGSDIKGVRGTWWGAYNAVTEHLNHNIGRNTANRMNSLWFGQGKAQNEKALQSAVAMATATA